MSVVPRGSAEAAIFMQTGKDKFEQFSTRKSFGVAKQVQCSQSPVEAVEAQMLGEPVLELVFALERVSAGCWCRVRLRGYEDKVRTVSRLWM
jgi:hypothetical protein